jgi:AcrR family transcriptional regulator
MPQDMTHIIPPQQARSTRFLMRVLEAAEHILRRDGSEALTMPAVAVEAGVSVGGIYRRFQTKQDLLRAIKDRHLTRSEEAMEAAMAGPHADLAAVAETFVAALIRGGGSQGLFGVIMEGQGSDPVMYARGQASIERLRTALAGALKPFRDEIRHADRNAAIDMAFLIALSVFMRRAKEQAKGAAKLPPWSDVRRELARAMVAYLVHPFS